MSFWSEHEAIAPQWLCWAHPTDTLLMQSITPGGAFSTDVIYLQADKMYALGLNINVITLTVINQLLLRIAALPQLSMSLIFSPPIFCFHFFLQTVLCQAAFGVTVLFQE